MASPKSSSRASHKPHNPRARRAALYRVGLLCIPPIIISLLVYGTTNFALLLITLVAAAASVLFDMVRHKSRLIPFPVYLIAVWALQILVIVFLSRQGWSSEILANPLAGLPANEAKVNAGLRGPGVPPPADQEYGILIDTTLDENGQHPPVDFAKFPTDIKTISVVLAAHNEQKYLERTCESIYAETPSDILKEIIVVDDASEPPLRRYLKNYPNVKVIRHTTRQGLIRSKTDGANAATGDMVVFLDAHVKPEPNWAQPLIRHANINYKRVVVPVIPILNGETWEIQDSSAGTKMMFDWGLGFNWFEDGNDLEQSIRIWLCGGEIYVARDSRVAHVFRPTFPYKIDNTQVYYNKIRTVEVWFDDYKDYFYSADPYAKGLREKAMAGGIEDRLKFKKDMQCKPFQYYVDKFRKVFEMKGMLASDAYLIKDDKSELCVSSGGYDGTKLVLRKCNEKDEKQRWNDNPGKAIRNHASESCMDANAGVADKQGMTLITYFCMMNNANQNFQVVNGMIQWQGWCAEAEPVEGAELKFTECSTGFLRSSSEGNRSLGGQLGAFQSHLIKNPDVMEQMLNTPVMQTVLQNGDMLTSLISMNGQIRKLMEENPELERMLNDPSVLKASSEAFQNPAVVRELISSTETAMANIDGTVPGGYKSLKEVYKLCSEQTGDEGRGVEGCMAAPQLVERREAGDDTEELGELSKAPEWVDEFDPSAMAAMMQDPNMHQLMASLFRSAENAHKVGARTNEESSSCPSLKPFCEASLLQQMFDPKTLESMSKLEGSMSLLDSNSIPEIGEVTKSGGKVGPKISGLSLSSPAANFEQSFSSFIDAQNENPEVLYRTQLNALKSSGFEDVERNIAALKRSNGNVNRAIDLLIAHVNDPHLGEDYDTGDC
ncbi:hypothetical protein FOL47_009563 [Perkinsus chesapeaki]|uniref:UBA domain-containing protein n=1 Tax=Perkinsus chesapeaki TaxID=330153 RepID=A0A7J6L7I0_PERCH|nr:hypothetical protein FOL47_009563 [Perkinsus chesapeaki]